MNYFLIEKGEKRGALGPRLVNQKGGFVSPVHHGPGGAGGQGLGGGTAGERLEGHSSGQTLPTSDETRRGVRRDHHRVVFDDREGR